MGLRGVFQKAARTAFKVAGDVPVTCTYRQDKSDALEQVEPVEFPVQVLFGKLSWEMSWKMNRDSGAAMDLLPGDCAGTIRLDTMLVIPERGDTITHPGGTVYRVVAKYVGMGDILLTVQLRAL